MKVSDGASRYANVQGNVGNALHDLVAKAQDKDIKVWGWQVPHCDTTVIAKKEAKLLGELADGIRPRRHDYRRGGDERILSWRPGRSESLRQRRSGRPLMMPASHWRSPAMTFRKTSPAGRPNSMEIARKCAFQLPADLLWREPQRREPGGPRGGGQRRPDHSLHAGRCRDLSVRTRAAAHRRRAAPRRRGSSSGFAMSGTYQGYSFWHWGGAPMALWQVLNTVAAVSRTPIVPPILSADGGKHFLPSALRTCGNTFPRRNRPGAPG